MAVTGQTDEFYAGNKRTFRFTVTQKDCDGTVTDLPLAGLTIKWAMSRLSDGQFSTTPTLEKKSTVSGEIDIVSSNVCDVNLLSADTGNLSGTFYFELEITDGSGESVVVATGELTILRNVVNT